MNRGAIERKYSDEQRDAMALAFEDRRIRPASLVVAMAARGELDLPAFTCNEQAVRAAAAQLRKRRAGEHSSAISKLPPRDATERLRVALAERLDEELDRERRKPKGKRDLERLRQIGRGINEHARIPAPSDPRPTTTVGSGGQPNGQGATRGGLSGSLLTAHRGEGATAHDIPSQRDSTSENGSDGVAADSHTESNNAT